MNILFCIDEDFIFPSNNDFCVELSGNHLLVGSSELVAISSTRKMWNSE